jgi:hypothetical protein
MDLATETLIAFEDEVKLESAQHAATKMCLNAGLLETNEKGDIMIDRSINKLVENLPDEAPESLTEGLTSSFEQGKSVTGRVVPDAAAKFDKMKSKYDELLRNLKRKADTGKVVKDEIIREMTPAICDMLDLFLGKEVLESCVEAPLSELNQMLTNQTPLTQGLSKGLTSDFLGEFTTKLRSYFRDGGLRQCLLTFFDLIDVNNDSSWTREEFKNLLLASSAFTQARVISCSSSRNGAL